MEIFGIKFIGINAENGQKLLLSVLFIFGILIIGYLLRGLETAVNDVNRSLKIVRFHGGNYIFN